MPKPNITSSSAGFYCMVDGSMHFAPNMVFLADGTHLVSELKDSYQLPIQGWDWYESIDEAYEAHGLPYPPQRLPTDNVKPPIKRKPTAQ